MDGYLKIKTKIDNKEVDKQIKELEDKIKKLQENSAQNAKKQEGLEAEVKQYEDLAQQAELYRQTLKKLERDRKNMVTANPQLAVSTTPEYSNLEGQIEAIKQKYASATKELDKQAPKIDKVYARLELVKAKQTENNERITQFKQKIDSVNANNIQKGLDNVGKSLTNQIKKIGKLGMAVVGIRSAWFAVRGAINSVSQYNDQVATDFEYMKYAIAQALVPAVQQLVKILYTVLTYINAITTAWFGFNMFANSSAKSFEKMKSSASAIQKSLQGFDEMNTVSSSSSSSSSSGTPSMDLTGPQGEVPAWLKFIIDNKELITSILGGITGALISMKLLGLDPIMSLGIGLIIAGIIETIQGIINFIKDPSWENFATILSGLALILAGVAIAMLAVNAANPTAWIILAIALVAALVAAVIKYWDEIKVILGKVGDWINQHIIQPIKNFFINLWDGIVNGVTNAIQKVKSIFKSVVTFFKDIISSITGLFKMIGTKAGDIIGNTFKNIINTVLKAIENILNAPIRAINSLIGVINKVPGINLNTLSTFRLPRLAKGGVISQPTQAIIGEAGKEAVVPLENNLEWLDKMANMLASKIGGNGVVNVYLDGRLIQRQMAKKQQELAFATNS